MYSLAQVNNWRWYLINKCRKRNYTVLKSKDTKWFDGFVSINNVAIYPENSVLFLFSRLMDNGITIRMKYNDYLVDSYPSSIRLVDDQSTMIQYLSNFFDTPKTYINCLPPESSKYIIEYDRRFFLKKNDDKIAGTDLRNMFGDISLQDDYIQMYVVSTFLGEPIYDPIFVKAEVDKYSCLLDNRFMCVSKEGPSEYSVSSYPKMSNKEQKKLKKLHDKVDVEKEEVMNIAKQVSRVLMLGRCDVFIGLKDGKKPVVLNVSNITGEFMVSDFLTKSIYEGLLWNILFNKIEDVSRDTNWNVDSSILKSNQKDGTYIV